ncbi:M23 family metallopeptidase [Robiginitomaculum antarcticum]|uniref:M23 family metallopeptidase n=1 Tax=Robiginitomaculum antarcticum TaxID=437507 RepID=UPI00146157F9|nr:M23 family metallopeptidase [Robiginitomaculum antarcticum]
MKKWFPERQIIHRSGGQIQSFVIGQKVQICAVSATLLTLTWCIFTFANLAIGNNPLRSSVKQVKILEADFERRLANSHANEANALALLESQRREFQQARADFEQRHSVLREIMFSRGDRKPGDGESKGAFQYAHSAVMMAPVVRDRLPRTSRSDIITADDGDASTLAAASLSGLAKDQNDILLTTELKAQSAIEYSRAVMRETGLNVSELLELGPYGSGGPEIAYQSNSALDTDAFLPRTESIRARVQQASVMNRALSSIPLGHPIDDEFYRTSAFGARKDPFTKRTAFHGGVDFAGRRNASIVATADGIVSFVGIRAGYGRVVEINHDHGIVSRYAHLAKTSVKKGDNITKGDKVGGMGSSGRSTSTHLHYEVIFQGQTKDPEKFIRAGLYVQQD